MTKLTQRMHPTIVLLVALAAVLASAPHTVGAGSPERLLVATGMIVEVRSPIVAEEVIVEGILFAAPGVDLVIDADSVLIRSGGVLHTSPGATGGPTVAVEARAEHGKDAGYIRISAAQVTVEDGAVIVAGPGGHGGIAVGERLAVGGTGGRGGSIFINADSLDLGVQPTPGNGGDGGAATVFSGRGERGHAQGGNGGDSGFLYLNGEFTLLHAVESRWNGMLKATPPEVPIIPLGGGPSLQPEDNLFTVESPKKPRGDEGGGGIDGGLLGICANTGGEGGPGISGGNGGRACGNAKGADGANGHGGLFVGGDGSPGAPGVGSTAKGGNGGMGVLKGGDGGSAESNGVGGNGGNGGWGLVTGGNGGRGGDGKGGEAFGGRGGDSLCGPGGTGGGAAAAGVAGLGGQGGKGGIADGSNGEPGDVFPGQAVGGEGGFGLNLPCPET